MKILYAIQATGNGHTSRAREIIPHLLNHGQVDVLISGTQSDVCLPYLITYKKTGISYTFGKRGGINFIDSIKKLKPLQYAKDVAQFPVNNYDIIINDFEPITAWACKLKHKPCIALSHQAAYLSSFTPRPLKRNAVAEQLLKHYAPSSQKIGFHFRAFDDFIFEPVIRTEVRDLEVMHKPHITVYLPAHADELLLKHFTKITDIEWHVYSKHCKQSYKIKNVLIAPVNNQQFLQSLAQSSGLVTAAGFESPAEAMFLGKKVLCVPMQNQYEQQCNAAAMKQMGVTVINKIEENFTGRLKSWIHFAKPVKVHFPNQTAQIVASLFANQ